MFGIDNLYGFIIAILFVIFIISLCISVVLHRKDVKLYSILLREDGRISKVAIAFLFVLPVILYEVIFFHQLTPGLDYILLTIFGTELGVKVTDKIPDMFRNRNNNNETQRNKGYEQN